MGKNQSASNLTNIIQYNNGNISFVSGSTTLMQISSSGAITTTGVISGSNALSASYAASTSNALAAQTASFVLNAQSASYVLNAQSASYVLNGVSSSYSLNGTSASYAASASNALSASNAVTAQTASFANTFTVGGTLTAQTLVVQTITSSVDFVTGSTRFGSLSANTHTFTGSILISGSITAGTANVARGTAFTSPFLTNGGNLGTVAGNSVRLGSFSFDAGGNGVGLSIYGIRQATGSNWTTTGIKLQLDVDNSTDLGGNLFISSNGYIGVNNTNPAQRLDISSGHIKLSDGYGLFYGTQTQIYASEASKYVRFDIAGSSAVLFVSSSGNVGINTTSPSNVLHAYATLPRIIADTNSRYAVFNTYVNGLEKGAFYWDNTDNIIRVQSSASIGLCYNGSPTNYAIYINPSGNVGIGTTSPGYYVHIYGTATGHIKVENPNAGGYALYQAKSAGSSYTWQWGAWTDNSYRVGQSGVGDFMTVTPTGIGVGNTSPQAKLDLGGALGGNYRNGFFFYNDNNGGPYYGTKNGFYMDQFGLSNNSTLAFSTAAGAPGTLYFCSKNTGVNDSSSLSPRMVLAGETGAVLINNTSAVSGRISGASLQVTNEVYSRGSSGGYFWEDRVNSTYWYGWYATGNTTVYFYNGNAGSNIATIAPSTGVYTAISDINKKKDFEESTIGLDAVMNLKPTLYRMKTEEETAEKHLGFIAQEVKDYIPQAYVETQAEDEVFIGVNDRAILAAAVKAIQELNTKLDAANAEIEALKSK